jgi:cob(I)alamin adenosyltransferase
MTTSGKSSGEAERKKPKAVGWRIAEPLRHRLTSHAEYLSSEAEKEISTESMVAGWLEERLKEEERRRALRTLGITEENLPKQALKNARKSSRRAERKA